MRTAARLGIALIFVVAATAGCASVSTQPSGAWTACGSVLRPTSVRVQQTVAVHSYLKVLRTRALARIEQRVAVVRGMYLEACVIAGHPVHPGGAVSCPGTPGPGYQGAFYDRSTEIATFSYAAGGCETFSLAIGSVTATTDLFGSPVVLAAQASLDTGLAIALGIPPAAVHTG